MEYTFTPSRKNYCSAAVYGMDPNLYPVVVTGIAVEEDTKSEDLEKIDALLSKAMSFQSEEQKAWNGDDIDLGIMSDFLIEGEGF